MPRTIFRPQIDGFAFANSWIFDQNETAQVRAAFAAAVNSALVLLAGPFGAALAFFNVGGTLTNWVASSGLIQYGLCGGMAFGALDYYKAGLVVPRGTGPNDVPDSTVTEGETLRNYLWQRLLDSLFIGGAASSTLAWMAVLHLIPREWPFLGGHPWLLAKSREHWNTLKAHIDSGEPWPIGLVGTTTVPFSNHQVLVYGYDDPGDNTGTMYVYDMNCPGNEQTIQVDFSGQMLEANESCPNPDRGPLRGFFCEAYSLVSPPDVGLGYGALQREQSRPEVFVIYGGARFHIPSPDEFTALGLSWSSIRTVPDGSLSALANVPRDGTLLRERSRPEVYVVFGGARFHIPSPDEFAALGLSWSSVRIIPDGSLSGVPNVPRDGTLLRERSGPEVYIIRGGSAFHITTPQRFAELALSWWDIRVVPNGALAGIPFGGYEGPAPPRRPRVAVSPFPVPLDTPVDVTVGVTDAQTGGLVTGTVRVQNPGERAAAFATNAAFNFTFRRRFTRRRVGREWEVDYEAPTGTVRAPGYEDADVHFGFG